MKSQAESDYYAADDEDTTRGGTVMMEHSSLAAQVVPKAKWCERFSAVSHAPMIPSDPMYVLPRTRLTCKAESAAYLGSVIIEGIESFLTPTSKVGIDANRMKISVATPSGSTFKVKLFSEHEDDNKYTVVFRKDAGDGFAFSLFYIQMTKYLLQHGIDADSSSFMAITV